MQVTNQEAVRRDDGRSTFPDLETLWNASRSFALAELNRIEAEAGAGVLWLGFGPRGQARTPPRAWEAGVVRQAFSS